MALKVIGIGDNVCDKYYPAMIMYPGGQAMNFSVYAKMLGANSAYMGVFGRDAVADHIIRTLDELGVDHSRCRQYDGENGYAKVRLIDGDREFISSNKGGIVNQYPLDLTEEDLDYIKGFQILHTSNNGHFDRELPKVRRIGIPISYDFSGRWNEEYYLEQVAPYVDFAFASCGDAAEEEIRAAILRFAEKGCRIVVATRGGKGSLIYDGKKFYPYVPKLVDAVDTLGAGDSFATAFLLELLKGGTIEDAMQAGSEFAAKTCMVHGAFGHGISFEES